MHCFFSDTLIWPQECKLNSLCRGPQDNDTCLISKLYGYQENLDITSSSIQQSNFVFIFIGISCHGVLSFSNIDESRRFLFSPARKSLIFNDGFSGDGTLSESVKGLSATKFTEIKNQAHRTKNFFMFMHFVNSVG